MTQLVFAPSIPLALWLPLAAAAIGLLTWYALRGRRLADRWLWRGLIALMALAVAAPLAILLNPTWVERHPPPQGKPRVTLVVDTSASMGVPDVGNGELRLAAARKLAAQMARELEPHYEVQWRSFAGTSTATSPEALQAQPAAGETTDLCEAIEGAIERDHPLGQALILLSDGANNGPGGMFRLRQTIAKARAMNVPIYTKTFGTATVVDDIEVQIANPQEVACRDQKTPLYVLLQRRGQAVPAVQVALREGGRVLERRTATFDADGRAETIFSLSRPKAGAYAFEVRAETPRSETVRANDTARCVLRVVDEPVHVLLVEGKPYWDSKFLLRTLAADPSIALTFVVRMKPDRWLVRRLPQASLAPSAPSQPAAADSVDASAADASAGEAASSDAKSADANLPDAENAPDRAALESATADATTPAATTPAAEAKAAASGGIIDSGDQGIETWSIESGGVAPWRSAEELARCQVIILGRDADTILDGPSLEALRRWVIESDGAVVCFRGPPAAQINRRLDELLPVQWTAAGETRFRPCWTAEGRAMHWLAGDADSDPIETMPSLVRAARAEKIKPLGAVWATAESGDGDAEPVIVSQPVGGGRVVAIEGSGMWRWAFLPPAHQDRDEVYTLFWRSLVRWLVSNVGMLPSQRVALRMDRVSFRDSDSPAATLLLRMEQWPQGAPSVELRHADWAEPKICAPTPMGDRPGEYRVMFGRLPPGSYDTQVIGATADEAGGRAAFDVRASSVERLEVAAQPGVMRLLAEGSGGEVLGDVAGASVHTHFQSRLQKARPDRIVEQPAWDRWWVLVGALMLWGIAWAARRNAGLV